jgi:hypothetical protein
VYSRVLLVEEEGIGEECCMGKGEEAGGGGGDDDVGGAESGPEAETEPLSTRALRYTTAQQHNNMLTGSHLYTRTSY